VATKGWAVSMAPIVAAFGVGLVVVLLATPLVIRFSRRHGLYDRLDARKNHTGRKPRLGGIGMFLGLVLAMAAGVVMDGRYTLIKTLTLAAGFLPVFAVSLWDDIRSRPWWLKLAAQAVGAIAFAPVEPPPSRHFFRRGMVVRHHCLLAASHDQCHELHRWA
jgi:UDP-GlcNAc:undecaprenyl-phosphate GlcNAc-1-phosphate transferase